MATDSKGNQIPLVAITGDGGAPPIMQDTSNVSPTTQVMTVNTGAAVLVPSSPLTKRRMLVLSAANTNAGTIYIGGSAVTADTTATGGFPLLPGDKWWDAVGTGSLYATADKAGMKLFVYER